MKASNLAALGRFDELSKIVDELELQGGSNAPGNDLANIANELAAHGHVEQAKDMASRAYAMLSAKKAPTSQLWSSLVVSGDLEEAARLLSRDTAKLPGQRALMAALQGDRQAAERFATELAASDTAQGSAAQRARAGALLARARVAAVLGDKPGAMRLLRQAVAN